MSSALILSCLDFVLVFFTFHVYIINYIGKLCNYFKYMGGVSFIVNLNVQLLFLVSDYPQFNNYATEVALVTSDHGK